MSALLLLSYLASVFKLEHVILITERIILLIVAHCLTLVTTKPYADEIEKDTLRGLNK